MAGFNLGGLAQGFAQGLQAGQEMDLRRTQIQREKRAAAREDAQDAAYKAVADLAEARVGPGNAPVYAPSGDAGMAARGVASAAGAAPAPGVADSAHDVPATLTSSHGGAVTLGSAGPSNPADAGGAVNPAGEATTGGGVVRGAITRQGVGTGSAPAPEKPGPKTDDDRLGFAIWRNPALLNDPVFLNGAAHIFLKAGMPEGVSWLQRAAHAQQENTLGALRSLLSGDPKSAEEQFNTAGRFKIEPGSLKPLDGGKWQATLQGTGQTMTFDPREMFRSYLSPKDYFTLEEKKNADAATSARADRTFAETQRHNQATEAIQSRNADLRAQLAQMRANGKGPEATALERNLTHLVDKGIAKDEAEAFRMLRTGIGKSEEDQTLSLMGALMKSPSYFGPDGRDRALRDARAIVRSVRGGSAPQPGSFKSADDVRAAFRAGTIDRATAEQTLRQQFGFEQ